MIIRVLFVTFFVLPMAVAAPNKYTASSAKKQTAALTGNQQSLDNTLYEVLNRLEQMQLEMRQLRGQLEEQNYAIEQLKKRQQGLYSDFEERIHILEGGEPSTDSRPDSLATPVQPLPPTTGSLNQQGEPSINQVDKEAEKQLYQEAYEKLRNGHYEQAIDKFTRITVQYPQGKYADNAQYWLGETYIVNQDMTAAQQAFSKVIENYPESPKVPDAMLKLGYLEADKENWQAARKYLNAVVKEYPHTTAAHLAGEKLAQLKRDKR